MAAARDPDPASALAALERELAAARELRRGYLFRGEEAYFRGRGVELVRRRAEALGLEVALHLADDPDFDANGLFADMASRSLFGAPRCVILIGTSGAALELLEKSGADEAPLVRAARSFLARGEGTLVVAAQSLRADHALNKALLAAGGASIACRKLWDSPPPWKPDPLASELVQWVRARARALGLALDARGALTVAAATGNDLAAIDAQLARARAAGGALAGVLDWSGEAKPYKVADDLLRGDLARALAGIEAYFRGGIEEKDGQKKLDSDALAAILFSFLVRGVRQHLAASEALEAGEDPLAAAAAAGSPVSPRGQGEFLARLQARPSAGWLALLDDLQVLERRQKGSGADAGDFAWLALRARGAAPPSTARGTAPVAGRSA
jgi:hypothetical protein